MTRQKRCNRSQRGRWDDRFDRNMDRFVNATNVGGHASICVWNGSGTTQHAAMGTKWARARGRVIGGAS